MYINTTQAALCEACPPGFYCVDSSVWPLECLPGEVCSGSTGYNSTLCPQVSVLLIISELIFILFAYKQAGVQHILYQVVSQTVVT